jgi:hypothetical protein
MLVADMAPGKSAKVEVWRKGSPTLTVSTGERKDEKVAANEKHAPAGALAPRCGPSPQGQRAGAKAAGDRAGWRRGRRAGLRAGDIVLSLGTPVTSGSSCASKSRQRARGAADQREDQQLFVPVELG